MWTEEKALELIEIYRQKSILWNPKDPEYFKKPLKNDAWREIANLLEISEDECKNKMISLLASFRREKGKIKKSEGTGKGTQEIYHSTWFAFEALSFLNDRDNPRKRLHSMMNETVEGEENLPSTSKTNVEPCNFQTKKIRKGQQQNQYENKRTEMLSEALSLLKESTTQPQPQTQLASNNTYVHFANYICSKMQKYPPYLANAVEQDITKIIFQADTSYMNQQNYQQQNSTYYTNNYCYGSSVPDQDNVNLHHSYQQSAPTNNSGYPNATSGNNDSVLVQGNVCVPSPSPNTSSQPSPAYSQDSLNIEELI